MSKKEHKTYCIKIIFLGETGVGKTKLLNVYLDKMFSPNEMPTSQSYESYQEVDMGYSRTRTISFNFKKLY